MSRSPYKFPAHLRNKRLREFDTAARRRLSDLWENLLLSRTYGKSVLCRFFTGEQGMRSFPFQQNRVRRDREANNKYKYHPCSVAQVIDFSLNTLSKAGSRQTHGRRRLHQTRSQSFSRACMHKYIIVVEKEARDFHAHITIYIHIWKENTCLGSVDRVRKIPSRCHKQIAAFRNFPARLQHTEKAIH